MAVKKSELYSFLWASCDELRGIREAEADLDDLAYARYPELTEPEVKSLVVDDKWLATLAVAIRSEIERISQRLAGRVRELAERYAEPLPALTERMHALEAKVNAHLIKMGFGA